jgi:hypothetical protein
MLPSEVRVDEALRLAAAARFCVASAVSVDDAVSEAAPVTSNSVMGVAN